MHAGTLKVLCSLAVMICLVFFNPVLPTDAPLRRFWQDTYKWPS